MKKSNAEEEINWREEETKKKTKRTNFVQMANRKNDLLLRTGKAGI